MKFQAGSDNTMVYLVKLNLPKLNFDADTTNMIFNGIGAAAEDIGCKCNKTTCLLAHLNAKLFSEKGQIGIFRLKTKDVTTTMSNRAC